MIAVYPVTGTWHIKIIEGPARRQPLVKQSHESHNLAVDRFVQCKVELFAPGHICKSSQNFDKNIH